MIIVTALFEFSLKLIIEVPGTEAKCSKGDSNLKYFCYFKDYHTQLTLISIILEHKKTVISLWSYLLANIQNKFLKTLNPRIYEWNTWDRF